MGRFEAQRVVSKACQLSQSVGNPTPAIFPSVPCASRQRFLSFTCFNLAGLGSQFVGLYDDSIVWTIYDGYECSGNVAQQINSTLATCSSTALRSGTFEFNLSY